MALTDRRALKESAGQILEQNRDAAKRAVLVYAGTAALIPFAVQLINLFLGNLISDTSGIGSFQTRSTLETVRTVLELVGSVLPSFIYLGYLYVLLQFSESKPTQDGMLLQGFRNFWPVLRLMLLRYLLNYAVMMGGMIVGAVVVSFTPLVQPLVDAMLPYVESLELSEAAMLEIMEAGAPCMILVMLFGLVPVILLNYRLRMTYYALMEYPEHGAIHAMSQSFRITKGHCLRIFRLELSYWWYYLAQGAALALMFGALVPVLLGIELPVSTDVLVLIFEAVALAVLFAVQYLAANKVEMTFVQAYQELKQEQITPTFPAFPDPKNPFAT